MKYNVKVTCLLIFIITLPLYITLKSFAEKDFETQLTQANQYIDQNKFEKAEEIINELTKSDPENIKLLKATVLVLYYQEELDKALEIIAHIKETNKTLENKPEIVDFLYLEALILFEQNKKQKAMKILESIFQINPEHKASYTIYCSILAETNQSKEAKSCLKKLKKMN